MPNLVESHVSAFGNELSVFKAPGRVNLIGEHTDYNEGYVFPTPINRYICVAITPKSNNIIRLQALDFNEAARYELSSIKYDKNHLWANYVLGVVDALKKRGYMVDGFDMSIQGDVPLGAGLSSSAALETAVLRALNETYHLEIEPIEMAYIGKQCENEFVGVQSGIMDQFVSNLGQYGRALFIDCRTNAYSQHSLISGYRFVILNTMVSRDLADSGYNLRKAQCEEAVRIISDDYPNVKALRDVDKEILKSSWSKLPELVAKRARHVVSENQRVQDSLDLLNKQYMEGFGKLMYESHQSLRVDYEVTCEHLDILVDSTRDIDECLGSRMTGAGFGGCTVNLVEEDHVEQFIEKVSARYRRRTWKNCEVYLV
jgi:galactokinase